MGVSSIIIAGLKYATMIYFDLYGERHITFYLLVAINLLGIPASIQSYFMIPFFTQVADKKIGGTAITAFTSIINASINIPSTLGL